MTRDYAKKKRRSHFHSRTRQYTPPPPTFSWLWMASGVCLGILISAIVYWKFHSPPAHAPIVVSMKTKTESSSHARKKENKKQAHATEPNNRFEFYNLLPNLNAELLELATKSTHTDAEASLAQKPPPPTQYTEKAREAFSAGYIIQAGSFKQFKHAQELKAQLALLGFQTSIQTVKMKENEYWYRVYLGPFQEKAQAESSRQKLEQAQKLHSLVLKMRV